MRIIAGEFRGRKLLPPESEVTRPITDRVKQSLFDILSPRMEGATVYDCFAGTGSLGLECISRGAERVVFFEADRSAAARLRRNIEAMGVQRRTQTIAGDLFRWIKSAPEPKHRANLIFLDPPYRFLVEMPGELRALCQAIVSKHLEPNGIVIFRHDANDLLDLPPLIKYDSRTYGGMSLEFLALSNDVPSGG